MTDQSNKPAPEANPNAPARDYAVGYCKPPVHTQFRKGVSGNPRGRPRGMSPKTARALALKEAYRLITVHEGDKVMRLPIIQAVLRAQLALAVKGHSPAQRAALAAINALEQEIAAEAAALRAKEAEIRAKEMGTRPRPHFTNRDVARQAKFWIAAAIMDMGRPTPTDWGAALHELTYGPDAQRVLSDKAGI